MIQRFYQYIINEKDLNKRFPILRTFYTYPLRGNGKNSAVGLLVKLARFFKWCVKMDIITNNPFKRVEIPTQRYGTPYYLTIEERNKIADTEIKNKTLDEVRDLFVFQSLIGCRISDLLRLKLSNLIDGAIEYVPQKTRNKSVKSVRVPLNDRALKIIEKYKYLQERGEILPFQPDRSINTDLKKIFTMCNITRLVTIIDTITGQEIQRPLNELASSHLARRTFIGNLYKQVKDPELIGAMSGHAVGSKAFARYRTIDEDMKKEIIDLIN